jgi:hypothetical protein
MHVTAQAYASMQQRGRFAACFEFPAIWYTFKLQQLLCAASVSNDISSTFWQYSTCFLFTDICHNSVVTIVYSLAGLSEAACYYSWYYSCYYCQAVTASRCVVYYSVYRRVVSV